MRCVLGSSADRSGKLPLEAHIENTVKVLRNVKSRVTDAGLKIAIENHAGDMQAREVKSLIEAAGRDFVGSCLDSGNPLWTIEDPHLTLETLAPYVLTSHVRDTSVWNTPQGAAVAWTRMGEGNVGIEDYVRKFAEKCPGPPAIARNHRDRPALLQLSGSEVLGRVSLDPGLGVRALPGAGGEGHAAACAAPPSAGSSDGQGTRGFGSEHRWTQAFLARI